MAYAQALLARDVYREKEELESQARKKDLWSGLGGTIGGLVAMGITGGTAAPAVAAAWAGGLTLAGGAVGSKWAGDIERGKFFKRERKKIRKRLKPLGEENIGASLTAGVTAGIGQKVKMAKDVAVAKYALGEGATVADLAKVGKEVESGYKGLDFAGSTLGKTKAGQFLLGAKEFGLKDTLARHGVEGGKEYAERVTKEGLRENAPGILQEYKFGGGEVPGTIDWVEKDPLRGFKLDESRHALPSYIPQITQQAPRGRRDWTFSPSRGMFDWLQSKGFYKPDLEARERLLPSDERFV